MSFANVTASSAKPRSRHIAVDDFQPIMTINTTPLIDVMLVLLIMMIITIPVTTHKVPLDLPSPHPAVSEPPPVHRLAIDRSGRLAWDGRFIDGDQLSRRLVELVGDPARPDLHLQADPEARYERVDQVLAMVKKAGVTRLGFVGHQAMAQDLD